ncbi:MAG TPA: hypothetical protein VIA18_18910 [Polyangia bacterium]|jgi:hypothetical protein|nr:hypothetical protein [Polyangia bacterium]HWE29060.1 hypothetical protein [Polyangia bacterium]
MTSLLRRSYTSLLTAGLFVVRMLLLGLMALLQLTIGGAEIRPASREAAN